MSIPRPASSSSTALVTAVVVCFIVVVAAVVALAIAVPDGANTGSLITILLGSLAPTIASLVGLAKVQQVQDDTHQLVNGRMDSKIRAAVADVLPEHMTDPEAREQIAADRVLRTAAHEADRK